MTIADEKPTFTQEDLAEIEADDGDETESAPTGGAGDKGKDAKSDDGGKGEDDGKPGKTIATGADTEVEDKAKEDAAAAAKAAKVDPNELTADLRKLIASHYAAGDKKAEAKELKRLDRIKDIKSIWGMYREMEGKFTSGDIIKKPGKNAKPEDMAEFHKSLGVPEKPEGYMEHIKLESGAVIGEADKPMLTSFTEALHKAGAPPSAVNAAANWYYQRQEQMAAEIDEADEDFRRESEKTLKEELGPAFRRQTNAISSLFATAPGGADAKNANSLYSRLVGGRTADGKLIGNDPEVMRWLIGLVSEVNPAATVVEDGVASVKSIDTELAEIQALRKSDRTKYWSPAVQAREAELYAAKEKMAQRASH